MAANSLTQYLDLYREHRAELEAHAPEALNRPRAQAYAKLAEARLPEKGDEGYPLVSVNSLLAPDYGVNINRVDFPASPAEAFRCGVPNISTMLAIVVNDTYHPTQGLHRNLPEGVTVMSLARAAREMPELVERYYGHIAGDDPACLLNTLLAQDGVLVHVAKGIEVEKPLQIVNLFSTPAPLMGVRRLLIVLEDGARASVLSCSHSAVECLDFQVAEIYLGRDASLGYYELEESSPSTSRLAQTWVKQQEGSRLTANSTTLSGGKTRNSYRVSIEGEHASTRLTGMALADGDQLVDNATRIDHYAPKCESDQMFKYILNDRSQGAFFGTIVVDESAKYTKAYQSNRNILGSREAKMHTRPQLEIYCDEVKCSHGATVGQLDANALFYMRSRGIPEAEAKMMLMQAFMADVIDSVEIPSLKSRLQQLIEMRLAGCKASCGDCNQC